jgi:hypothetical protein
MESNRLDYLLQRHLDMELATEERDELQVLLLSMPEARQEYWRQARMHAALRLLGEQCWGQRDSIAPRKLVRWRVPKVAWSVAAGVIFCAALLWQMGARDEKVAELVDAQRARWENSTLATEPGGSLGAGRLRLAEGLARIRFARGAELTLEGPAELELVGEQVCRLHRGSLVAHVPEAARGFSVLTPSATLIDHGTDFGISMDVDGHARVHVMQGEVELRHVSGSKPMRLTTRQMTDITLHDLLPPRALETEPRLRDVRSVADGFTAELTTLAGRGAAAYVSEPRTGENQSDTLLFLENCAEPGYGRKVLLRFDLRELLQPETIREARLVLNFSPTDLGYASHGGEALIAVYALTDDTADEWDAARVTWDRQPAFDSDSGRVDESKAVRVGEFTVPRGVQSGSFVVDGARLVASLKADANGLLTLILVRENRIEVGGGLVLGIAGNRHPLLAPPTLRVR